MPVARRGLSQPESAARAPGLSCTCMSEVSHTGSLSGRSGQMYYSPVFKFWHRGLGELDSNFSWDFKVGLLVAG